MFLNDHGHEPLKYCLVQIRLMAKGNSKDNTKDHIMQGLGRLGNLIPIIISENKK